MVLLDRVFRLSGLTHGEPPYSFSPSPVGVVPMVPNLVSRSRMLGKRALVLKVQTFLQVKLPSALSYLQELTECTGIQQCQQVKYDTDR
jgi:hypothetical protein